MIRNPLLRLFSEDIAVDLGTANTLFYTEKEGIVINEPSLVAFDLEKKTLFAVGNEAKSYIGRTPEHIALIRPLQNGGIADFDMTRRMIEYFVRKVLARGVFVRPSFVICVPGGITQIERRAVIDSATYAGASSVRLIEEVLAASLGAGLSINDPVGRMVLVIGGGTSEVAVISLGGIVQAHSIRVAGDAMTAALARYIHQVFRLSVGEATAEGAKLALGSLVASTPIRTHTVAGKDAVTGEPRSVTLTEAHVREALAEPLRAIVEAILRTLEKTPPELAADLTKNGLLLTGGGSLLRGLDTYLAEATHLTVVRDSEPLTTVLRGTAKVMLEPRTYKHVFLA